MRGHRIRFKRLRRCRRCIIEAVTFNTGLAHTTPHTTLPNCKLNIARRDKQKKPTLWGTTKASRGEWHPVGHVVRFGARGTRAHYPIALLFCASIFSGPSRATCQVRCPDLATGRGAADSQDDATSIAHVPLLHDRHTASAQVRRQTPTGSCLVKS